MRTIYKYPFRVSDTVTLEMPEGARIIHVAPASTFPTELQGVLWAEVDTDKPLKRTVIYVRGTGYELPEGRIEHIGSYQHGLFAWHVYAPKRAVYRGEQS